MRLSTFSSIFVLTIARNVNLVTQQDELLWAKLENYQKVTGINDDKMMAIWEKSMSMKAETQGQCRSS